MTLITIRPYGYFNRFQEQTRGFLHPATIQRRGGGHMDRTIGFLKKIFYGMSQRLKERATIILGLLGSIVGLLYSYAVMSYSGYGCQCDWSVIQTFFGSPLIIGSVIGLAGCVLYPVARK